MQLIFQPMNIMRVSMPDGNNSMAAIQIKVFGSCIIINQTAGAFYNVDRVDGVYVE